jgi:transposase
MPHAAESLHGAARIRSISCHAQLPAPGDPTILGKISKRGNRCLRVLFVQAAWVVLIKPQSWERHGLKRWLDAAKSRLHRNVLAIALANKLARIAWGVLARGRAFDASRLQAA